MSDESRSKWRFSVYVRGKKKKQQSEPRRMAYPKQKQTACLHCKVALAYPIAPPGGFSGGVRSMGFPSPLLL